MRWRGGARCGRAVTADLTLLEQAARRLLPPGCGLGVSDPRLPRPAFPGEVVQGIQKRINEFRAGRVAARLALAELGLPERALPAGPDRAPIWPMGVHGSISHSNSLCLAVAGRRHCIGIDLEPATPLPADLRATILDDAESGIDDLHAKLIFSAKEAVYKAQYALTRQMLGFDAVTISLTQGGLSARFRQEVGPIPVGRILHGHWAEVAGHFLTLVTL